MTEFDRVFEEMAAKWPSAIVARQDINKFTGGLLSPKTMANKDMAGDGVEERFFLFNKVVYPIDSLGAWLKRHYSKSWKQR